MKRRTFLLQSGAGLAAAALPGIAESPKSSPAGSVSHASSAATTSAGAAHRTIVHPGILQTRADLEFMKAKIRNGENPWKSAWDRWLAEPVSSLDFKPKAFAHIVRGAFGAGQIGGAQLSTSAAAVSSHVLQWYVTGEEAHARKVIEIFDAWSSTLADFSENDAMLLAGWTGGEFVNAAEILRASYPAWPAASLEQFKRMLLTVYVPLLRMYYPEANGNWDGAMMFTLLAIGIFCEDRGLMDAVYDHYRTGPVNSGITRYIYPSGQCEETCRDQGHVQLGLGYFAETAIVAWNQGVDLFSEADNRLALGYEYTARYMLGEDVQAYGKISAVQRGRFTDVYEGVLQHYRYVKHIAMPYTEQAAARAIERSHGIVTLFRGDKGETDTKLQSAPVPSKVALLAGAQGKPGADIPSASIPVAAGQSIQDALDQLGKNGGGTIALGSGVHTLPATLRLPSGVSILGTGLDCVLFLDPNARGSESAIQNAVPDLHDIVLRDFVIEGAVATQTGSDPNSGVQQRRLQRGPIRAGIVLAAEAQTKLRNLRFEHVTVRNCTYSAVHVFGAEQVEIVNCDFAASGSMVPPGPGKNHNLKLNQVWNVAVTGSRLADSMWGSGLAISFGRNVTVRDCELTRNELNGVTIAESLEVTVENCLIEGNSGQGIAQQTWMNPNRGVVLKNNVLRNNTIPV